MKKRLLAGLLSVCMAWTLLPAAALAANAEPFEYNGAAYATLGAAVAAVGKNTGTIYVTADAAIVREELVTIPAGADITITSKRDAPYTLTRMTAEWAINLTGGILRLENIIFDGNAQWQAAASGPWYYERTAANNASSPYPLLYTRTSGSGLYLEEGSVIQNFYINRAGTTNPSNYKYPMLGGALLQEVSVIAVDGATVEINGGIVRDNATKSDVKEIRKTVGTSNLVPGPFYAESCAITMNGGQLTRNWIVSDVGHSAVYEVEPQLTRYSSDLRNGACGGNLTMVNGSFTMNGGDISFGYANQGGGIAATCAALTINGGSIRNNTALSGGGVFLWDFDSSFTMTDGAITDNILINRLASLEETGEDTVNASAPSYGGGVYIQGTKDSRAQVEITGGRIQDNVANQGGGLRITNADVRLAGNADIKMNKALALEKVTLGTGGGLLTENVALTIDESAKIAYNEAGGQGGGLFAAKSDSVEILGQAKILQNQANQGGGIVANGSAQVVLSGNASVTKNTAETFGGGLFLPNVLGKAALLEHAEISGNTTKLANGGGAVCLTANTGAGAENAFYLDGENTTVEGDISLYAFGGVAVPPSITLVGPVAVGKTYSVAIYNPAQALEKTVVVSPGSFTYNTKTYALSDAEPYETNFANALHQIRKGSRYAGEGLDAKLVIGGTLFTVTFDANGGAWTADAGATTKAVPAGNGFAAAPAAPTRSDYTFAGWHMGTKESSGAVTLGEPWDAATEVTADMTVYAKWDKAEGDYIKIDTAVSSTMGTDGKGRFILPSVANGDSYKISYAVYADPAFATKANASAVKWAVALAGGFEGLSGTDAMQAALGGTLDVSTTSFDAENGENTTFATATAKKSGVYRVTAYLGELDVTDADALAEALAAGRADYCYVIVPGDVNKSGGTDIADETALNVLWQQPPAPTAGQDDFRFELGDMNLSGGLDIADETALNALWQSAIPN